MPKALPQDITRSFNTRYSGIFKKSAELHAIDRRVRISIIIEKPGTTPFVFSTEESGHSWPPHLQDYVEDRGPIVKRPSHYQSLSQGISEGRVRVIGASSLSPPPPYMPGTSDREQTPDSLASGKMAKEMQEPPPSYQSREGWCLSATPPRIIPSRTSSPLPMNVVLPSKMPGNDR
ncbi:uncharacterized protein K460DRAFT_410710 [Cucurbitaria berberidis CBS 394.84]|uniref:MADS-box domain-containing protein n=1 Tax=Cucurbitaria berberidis CBS 394.84 TaxID=1168544 RepID=A0A9P4G7D9_9PLEO|nr:uncharacterized protein K460DRAFT_410710 [Cucurbitaria berberidis CBS 394.84]KAF1840099.1 hypothetical protein K460DRAFT_410710 [Cucurbitaria berberidis CBS 394.84]